MKKFLDLFRTSKNASAQATLPAVISQTLPAAEAKQMPALPTLHVGDEVPVGYFFWIRTCIGFADNAMHGHGIDEHSGGGSADTDCKVRILGIDGGYATVVLLRPEIPYGAPAPHGTIFVLPVEEVLSWPAVTEERLRKQRVLNELRRQIGPVVV